MRTGIPYPWSLVGVQPVGIGSTATPATQNGLRPKRCLSVERMPLNAASCDYETKLALSQAPKSRCVAASAGTCPIWSAMVILRTLNMPLSKAPEYHQASRRQSTCGYFW
eukprot:6198607-Pleurochrysis_carterae.AAC.1